MSNLAEIMLDHGLSLNRPYAVRSSLTPPTEPLWLTLRVVRVSRDELATVVSPSVVNKCGKTLDDEDISFIHFLN